MTQMVKTVRGTAVAIYFASVPYDPGLSAVTFIPKTPCLRDGYDNKTEAMKQISHVAYSNEAGWRKRHC